VGPCERPLKAQRRNCLGNLNNPNHPIRHAIHRFPRNPLWSGMNASNMMNDNFGFYSIDGTDFHSVDFPTKDNASPPVNQLAADG
jgi:hypothetical protein